MVFSTLGGGLTAIDPITSEIRWTIADGNYKHIHIHMLRDTHILSSPIQHVTAPHL